MLASFLAAFGNAAGARAHAVVGATWHPARLSVVLVGRSGKARKGESWTPVRRIMAIADSTWSDTRVSSGLSSGEGVIAAVRDAVERTETDRATGGVKTAVVDAGVDDKRLLVVEPEFARALRVMKREGNVLSPVLRHAWDDGSLRIMTKQPIAATGAHVSVIGHITSEELARELDDTSAANGFANRFLWLTVARSKMLPRPRPFTDAEAAPLAARVRAALDFAEQADAIDFDEESGSAWDAAYPDLTTDERGGMAGAILGRLEAQTLRLALLYALLDRSPAIRVSHLAAALAVADYAERSVSSVFGARVGDPTADAIVDHLRSADRQRLTRSQIRDALGRHVRADRMAAAIETLTTHGRVAVTRDVDTGGRPAEWVVLR